MTDLKELIAKCERATGGDRELDHWVQASLVCEHFGHYETPDAWVAAAVEFRWATPRYTTSIDAALALLERVLPGWIVESMSQEAAGTIGALKAFGWCVEITDGSHAMNWKAGSPQGRAPTLPLAIILATLKALEKGSAT